MRSLNLSEEEFKVLKEYITVTLKVYTNTVPVTLSAALREVSGFLI